MTLSDISPLIESSLVSLNLDPTACRGANPGQWTYTMKDATMWIDAFSFPAQPEVYYIQVMSPLCAVPDKRADAFFQDLLEINYKMYGSWMCKKDGWIYVLSLREAEGLDKKELDATLNRVSFYSTDYYSKLSFKYEDCWLPKTTGNGNSAPGPAQ